MVREKVEEVLFLIWKIQKRFLIRDPELLILIPALDSPITTFWHYHPCQK